MMNNIRYGFKHAALLGFLGIWAFAAQVHAETSAGSINNFSNTIVAEFPPQGKLIDIGGGRKMQIDCRGTGSPTVVFESGLDISGSLDWSFVHDKIAKTTRACAYSRAGILWSDPHDAPQVAKSVAKDLRATLINAGESAPFVMVGHSLGGPYMMTYTKYFGTDVAGLVFVDSSHPDQMLDLETLLAKFQSVQSFAVTVKPSHKLLTRFNQLQTVLGAVIAYATTSTPASLKEEEALEQTLAEAGTFRELGDRPIIVLTAREPLSAQELALSGMTAEQIEQNRLLGELEHADMATWSTNSQHLLVPDAGHFIQIDRPDVVIAAVRSVVKSVRTHKRVKYHDAARAHAYEDRFKVKNRH